MVLGLIPGSMKKSDMNKFQKFGDTIVNRSSMKNILGFFAPEVSNTLDMNIFDEEILRFFSKKFQDVIQFRRKNKVIRNDLFDSLMQLIDKGFLEDEKKSNESIEYGMRLLLLALC